MTAKQVTPVALCTKCGKITYGAELINQQCSASYDLKPCKGAFRSALSKDDWAECGSCDATGRRDGRPCDDCRGVGWRYVRKR